MWRECIIFAKTRLAGPGPNSSSRRFSRGAKGRFGRSLAPCKKRQRVELILGQQGPLELSRATAARGARTYRGQDANP